MKIFGITSIQATRLSKAEFVLPVPMGSPRAVVRGRQLRDLQPGPAAHDRTVGPRINAPGRTTGRTRATGCTNNSQYATATSTASSQGYRDFGLSVAGADTIDGIEIRVDAKSSDSLGCRLGVALSWDNGTTWSSERFADLTNDDPPSPVPRPRRPGDASGPVTPGRRRLRQRQLPGPGPARRRRGERAAGRELPRRRDDLARLPRRQGLLARARDGSSVTNLPTPAGEAVAPTTQGFWGAVFTRGGVRRNGDRYSPQYFDPGVANAEYTPTGYDYTITFALGRRPGAPVRSGLLRDRRQRVGVVVRRRRPLDHGGIERRDARSGRPGDDRVHPLRHEQHARTTRPTT